MVVLAFIGETEDFAVFHESFYNRKWQLERTFRDGRRDKWFGNSILNAKQIALNLEFH